MSRYEYPDHDYRPRALYWLGVLAEAGLPHLRPEAADLLANGWKEDDWAICVRGAELSLLGKGKDMTKAERKRYHEASEALRNVILYAVGDRPDKPKPVYLWTGSGWSWDDRETGLAWSPGSGVCAAADRRVRLSWRPRELPYQLELDLQIDP